MGIATINIGDRQKGRLSASSVINCESTQQSISGALCKVFEQSFQSMLKSTNNPYGSGGASKKIVEIIRTHELHNLLKKSFFNLDAPVLDTSKNIHGVNNS
jgi:GDP/UDP-N,N'-diacetylbacillosamine 2-epimerase (hydrolysing)